MNAKRIARAIALAAVGSLVLTGAPALVGPATAATKSTLIIHSPAEVTSLNSSTSDGNTTYNAQVSYLTNSGFLYYDSNTRLRYNTKLGSMKITKNTSKDFRITYTLVKGQTWSDGTPITAEDMLLSHVVSADKYSVAAGLGNPATVTPAFDSVGYGSTYGENVVGLPVISKDKLSMTVQFKKPLPDWQLLAPGVSPVHALSLLADKKSGLQSASVNAAAKAKFASSFSYKTAANKTHLKAMGKVWTESYNIKTITSSTNKLLLISNGGFIVSSAVADSSITLVKNSKYKSGPAMATSYPVTKVIIKTIENDTSAVQALRNGEVDIYYNTNPSIAGNASLKAQGAAKAITVVTKKGAGYSHFNLRVGEPFGGEDPYKGPFFGMSQKAKDLRTAFLYVVPRAQMVANFIQPLDPNGAVIKPMDTHFAFQGTTEYNNITKATGMSKYTTGSQADRTAKALALVKKYYPTASADNAVVNVKLMFANSSGLRVSLAQLIKAEAVKAGFNVNIDGSANFSADITNVDYDATMFGYGLTSVSQATATAIYKSNGGNNAYGWNSPTIDQNVRLLESSILTPAQATAARVAIEKLSVVNGYGFPLYQNLTTAASNKELKNFKPAPLGANLVWNYWEWNFKP
jgi:peptide/nickel transport system substrate-binding protein